MNHRPRAGRLAGHCPLSALLLMASLTIATTHATAREITMLTVEWPPHYGSELPEQGLTTALVKAAFQAGGHTSTLAFVPWARALKEVKEGGADIVMGAYHSEARETDYYFSDRIYSLETGFVALDDLGIDHYDDLQDLARYRIGVSRGFVYSEAFDAAEFLDKHVTSAPPPNVRKLFRGRIDMTAMNFDLFRYYARQEGFCTDRVTFLQPPLATHGMYIMASRQVDDYRQIIEDFNRGLDTIRGNGEFDRIMARLRF